MITGRKAEAAKMVAHANATRTKSFGSKEAVTRQ